MSGRFRDEYYTTRGRDDRDVRVEVASHHSRSRASSPISRTPGFLLRDERSSGIGGQMVLRQREVETGLRHRSPSPVSVRSERRIIRPRSTSPLSDRMVIRERSRSRGPAERVVIRGRSRSRDSTDRIVIRERSRSRASAERVVIRERSRSRGPTERIRLVERGRSPESTVERVRVVSRSRSRRRSPSPDTYRARVLERAPSPQREVIQGPVIEREVITHWRDIDHGVVRAPSPSKSKSRRSTLETDIDIHYDSRHTDVNITHGRSRSRARSRSRSHVRRLSHERLPPVHYHDDTEIIVRSDRERLRIDDRDDRHRSHSAAPLRSPSPSYSEEADYITSRIDSRGRMGEAYHGATKDWTIVDVPPGTERVRMDGTGGGSTEVTWQRYNGVRRSKFIPGGEERDTYVRDDRSSRDSRELVIVDSPTYDRGKEREIEIETSRKKTRTSTDMWTEITKDLVCKEALEEAGYDYEETEWFFYVMQYLRYEDVLDLVSRSDRIRRSRRSRRRSTHEIEYDRDYRDYRNYHDHHDRHYHRDSSHSHRFHVGGGTRRHHYDLDLEYEKEKERDFILDRR